MFAFAEARATWSARSSLGPVTRGRLAAGRPRRAAGPCGPGGPFRRRSRARHHARRAGRSTSWTLGRSPYVPRGCTSASARPTSGTTRPHCGGTGRRWGCCPRARPGAREAALCRGPCADGAAAMGRRRARAASRRSSTGSPPPEAAGASPRSGSYSRSWESPRRRGSHLRRALERAHTPGSAEDAARAHLLLGELLRLRGDHAGALHVDERRAEAAARRDARLVGKFMRVNGADDLLRLGRWDEAGARLEPARRTGLGPTSAVLHHTISAHLHAPRGEVERPAPSRLRSRAPATGCRASS